MVSFEKLHRVSKRAAPMQIINYKHDLLRHKLYNSIVMSECATNILVQSYHRHRLDKHMNFNRV